MTTERDIISMAPLFESNVTAIGSIGCHEPLLPNELDYRHWVFPVDLQYKVYEVLERISGDEGVEDYPYIAVLGFKTFYGVN